MPSGWPSAMAPPLTLTLAGSSPSSSHAHERLRRERLVELDEIEVADGEAGPLQRLARGRDRADAHDRRIDAGDGRRDDPGHRPQAELAGPVRLDQQDRGRAVVDARAVAGRDRAALGSEGGPQAGQRLDGRVGARMLVAIDDERVALPLRDADRDDLVGEPAGLDGGHRALLALERECVLALARDAPALGHVLGGLAHRVGVVALGQARVDEPPAERRVGHLAGAAIVRRLRP